MKDEITMPATSPITGTRPISASNPTRRLMPGITKAVSIRCASVSSRARLASRPRSADRNGGRPSGRGPPPEKVSAREKRPAWAAWVKSMVGIRRRAILLNDVAPRLDPRKECARPAHADLPGRPLLNPLMRSSAASRVASALAKQSRTRVRTEPSG